MHGQRSQVYVKTQYKIPLYLLQYDVVLENTKYPNHGKIQQSSTFKLSLKSTF